MSGRIYRYTFFEGVPTEEVEETLALAVVATEGLHGEADVLLNAVHGFYPGSCQCVIDAATDVGRDLNRIFAALVSKEYGTSRFIVECLEATDFEAACA